MTDRQFVGGVYGYRDAAGELVYEAVHSRRPDGRLPVLPRKPGDRAVPGFDDLGDVGPIPYRLPELLNADISRRVLVVEREWDADRAIAGGLVATQMKELQV